MDKKQMPTVKLTEAKFAETLQIKKAFIDDSIAVVFECSELFVPYLSVALASLIACTNENDNYDIIVLSGEIKDHDQESLRNLCKEKVNISVRFFDPTFQVDKYVSASKNNYLVLNYFRMSLPWILKEYQRVINLGADLIIERDIAQLYREPVREDCYLAGALDLGYHGRLSMDISPSELGLSDPYAYVNADVLIFELEKIRNNYRQDDFMQTWQKFCFRCAEQDALNVIFDEHIHHLDLRWNVFPDRMTSEQHILQTPAESIAMWRQSLDDPYIIHYAAIPKPWDFPMVGFGSRWWSYARQSVYYEEIIRRMCLAAVNNGYFGPKKSRIRRAADVFLPMGSKRRIFAKMIFPKDNRLWRFLKRIQGLFSRDKSLNQGKKYGRWTES